MNFPLVMSLVIKNFLCFIVLTISSGKPYVFSEMLLVRIKQIRK